MLDLRHIDESHGSFVAGGKGHDYARGGGRNLLIALVLNVGITVAQVIGGILSGSLALLADAVHNGSDAAALGIAYGARRIGEQPADRQLTFGYKRAELIGAMINLTVLFVIALYLIYEAASRLFDPPDVAGLTVLVVGSIAFVEDAASALLLRRGQQESLNVRAAFIHMVADTLSTIGVIASGALILLYDIHWIDPVVTAAIAVYIIIHSYSQIRKTIAVLMESAPPSFDMDAMVDTVTALEGVRDVHHVHVWRIDEKRVALEAHVAVVEQDLRSIESIKKRVKNVLRTHFAVQHATLEIEIAGRTDHDTGVVPDE